MRVKFDYFTFWKTTTFASFTGHLVGWTLDSVKAHNYLTSNAFIALFDALGRLVFVAFGHYKTRTIYVHRSEARSTSSNSII